jgi:hypothetical protein
MSEIDDLRAAVESLRARNASLDGTPGHRQMPAPPAGPASAKDPAAGDENRAG